jgi:hypothetical protein
MEWFKKEWQEGKEGKDNGGGGGTVQSACSTYVVIYVIINVIK